MPRQAILFLLVWIVVSCSPQPQNREPDHTHFSGELTTEAIEKVGNSVTRWQLNALEENPDNDDPRGWKHGALYVGLARWADATGLR